MTANGTPSQTSTANTNLELNFKSHFDDVMSLIQEEWPEVKSDELKADSGVEKTVAAIASATDHSKVKIKRHLGELVEVAQKEAPSGASAKMHAMKDEVSEQLRRLVDKMENRSEEVMRYAKEEALPNAEKKMKENLLVTVLITLGVGFLVGILVRGTRR